MDTQKYSRTFHQHQEQFSLQYLWNQHQGSRPHWNWMNYHLSNQFEAKLSRIALMRHQMSQQFSQMCPSRKSKMLILLRIQNLLYFGLVSNPYFVCWCVRFANNLLTKMLQQIILMGQDCRSILIAWIIMNLYGNHIEKKPSRW